MIGVGYGCAYTPPIQVTIQLTVNIDYSNHLNTEYQTVWVSSIQMVKSCDLADHLKMEHFGQYTGFFQSGFQTAI